MKTTTRRGLRPPAVALAAAVLCGAVLAEAPHGAHAAAPPSAQASAPARPAAAASAPVSRDPLALVQQRLASRFGAQDAEAHGSAGKVVRVVSKAPTAAPAEGGNLVLRPHPPAARRAAADAHATHGAHGDPLHWSYEGQGGPEAWGRMKSEFAVCSSGRRQSPIDIRDGIKLGLDPVQFNYQPSAFKVQDNGHTIQVNLSPGNSIEVLGERYELLQFHFHRPSEESIDGRRFDMVAHFVHKSLEGRLAVVAVLLERGAAQAQLQQVWNNLPLEKGDTVAARATLDLARLLPEQRGYFTYMGSLTTPPCSEGVLWMVMKQPVQVSGEQVGVFARLYPMNARPIQSASGRLIKESN